MSNKKTMKNIKPNNKFWLGGNAMGNSGAAFNLQSIFGNQSGFSGLFKNAFSTNSTSGMGSGLVSGVASGMAGAAANALSEGRSSAGGNLLGTVGNAVSNVNPLLGTLITVAGGAVNNLFGQSYNYDNIQKAESDTYNLASFNTSASDTASLARDAASISKSFGNLSKDYIGNEGAFSHKVEDMHTSMWRDRLDAEQNVKNQLFNAANNIAANTLDNLERNYAAFGGPLFAYGGQTHGADFSNGLMFINNGGTHESNPYEGVPISMDQEGNPNLVEEGEIVWNDYVFSDRLKVPKSIKKKYKLGKREMTFANAVDKLSKESEERPNDPISIRGLNDILMHMAIEQETIKSKKQNIKVDNNKFATGGPASEMSWFQSSDGNYYQEYLDAVSALTKQQYIDYIKRSTGKDVTYTDKEFAQIKEDMTDNDYGQKHIDMYNIMQAQPLGVSNANLGALNYPVKPLNMEEVKLVDTWSKPTIPNNTSTPELNNYPTWMRYAPVIGYGALALTDALGITNKPEYSNAEAIIDESKRASVYNPVKFKPVGDYLTYKPFDTEYHASQLRALSGATRRNVINTSGGNRAKAAAGILAADNNTMNQMGDLYRKAAEYNLEQKQKVADFNRTTNITNSEGLLKADMANQSAAAQAKALGLEGLMAGYKIKEQAKLMSDQAKSANISGLLSSLGNIGYENVNRNMMNWGMASGTWAPSQWKYDPLTGKPVNQNE